jgi:HK97 family phage portal protein
VEILNIAQRILYVLTGQRSLKDPGGWLTHHFGGRPVLSGVTVNETTALQNTAVFACVRILAGTVASLPLPVFRRNGDGKEKDRNHPAYKLLHDRPNPEQSSFQWRQTGIAHQLLWGDWINEIEYKNNKPVALWPLPPWLVKITTGNRGFVFYDVSMPDGTQRRLKSTQILHSKNGSIDGLRGKSCIRAGAEAIGLSIAAEEFGARFYGEGANVGGIVEYPSRLSPDALKEYKDAVKESYAGLGKSHRIMMLTEGTKYHRVGIPPNEAQFLELRKFQVAEIGRLFGISQLHKIGDLERATFSNIEHQAIEFVVDTIRPLLINAEQEINYKLFEDAPYFAEFVIDGLLRGDTKSRNEAYAIMRQNGVLSANEWRAMENMNPLDDEQGNMYIIPMNMIPADQARMPEVKEPPIEENSREKRTLEQRQRDGLLRARTAKSYEHIFKAAAQKIVSKERRHVLKAIEKHMGERSTSSFIQWLDDYYRELLPVVRDTMRPAVLSLAEAIRAIASTEVSSTDANIEETVNEYLEAQAQAHTIRSKAVIRQLLTRAEMENLDAAELITARLDEWEENRAAQIANDSTVSVAGRIAKTVFIAAGIQRLMWVAIGADSCPYCQELNGKIVGVDQPFLARDSELESEDGRMPINKPTLTPPLHKNCQCSIVPV